MLDFSKLKDTKVSDLTREEIAAAAEQGEHVDRPEPGTVVVQFIPKAPKRKPSKA